MRVIFFFSQCSKIDLDFRNGQKDSEKIIRILENFIRIGCRKFSILQKEYLSPAEKKLAKCPSISHITKRGVFQVSFAHSDEEI